MGQCTHLQPRFLIIELLVKFFILFKLETRMFTVLDHKTKFIQVQAHGTVCNGNRENFRSNWIERKLINGRTFQVSGLRTYSNKVSGNFSNNVYQAFAF